MDRIDPVCGMTVSEQTPYKLYYKGRVYYFCSQACMEEFGKRADYYLTHGPQGHPHHPHHH